jgi:hypothetical protein
VRFFLSEQEHKLGTRVKREVNNKLKTGLKNPRQLAGRAPASRDLHTRVGEPAKSDSQTEVAFRMTLNLAPD